jgi:hypothetical protein
MECGRLSYWPGSVFGTVTAGSELSCISVCSASMQSRISIRQRSGWIVSPRASMATNCSIRRCRVSLRWAAAIR